MLTVTRPKTTELLSCHDKATIAAVLSWDLAGEITPEEIEAIRLEGEWVIVRLNFRRAVPLHRDAFINILNQQRACGQC
ncbi:MAG: hypothetical protein KME06_12115 [Kastovskya adunca ATA6-11-RM4]|jgi:hypothetical protein|nr:hypothetical protein [Kastovskya adunca ATA6-11-RM4]